MGVMVQERYGDEGVPQAYYRNQTVPLERCEKLVGGWALRNLRGAAGAALHSRKTV
jgi:hypothetical protein